MSSRATIYIRKHTSDVIGETGPKELSQRIAAMLARYESICRDIMPELSRAEWLATFDANNGSALDLMSADGDHMLSGIWANVHDSPGLGEKWKLDQDFLVERLRIRTPAELLAVQEACVRFWNHSHLDTDDALARSWARVSEESP